MINIPKFFLILSIFFTSSLITSCSGTHEQQLKKLDQIYGYCDNPQRNIRKKEYERCKMKEAAMGPDGKGMEQDPLNITEFFGNLGGSDKNVIISSSVNNFLWQGSLDAVSNFNLKIADSQGGIIQTEWIYDQSKLNQRCFIKIQILSKDLVSNGVKSKIICEDKIEGEWEKTSLDFVNEEKKLTIRILELAQEYSNQNS